MKISPLQFTQEISSTAHVFKVCTAYQPTSGRLEKGDNDTADTALNNISEQLHLKYRDFFNTCIADRLVSHWATDHAIELKPNSEPPYMRTYNMSPAELKVLDEYIKDVLVKEWICESQRSAGAPILFVPKKNDKLCLCVNYQDLNIITIKNQYSLFLISELLDCLDDSTVFLKINLKNAYHHIQIHEEDE